MLRDAESRKTRCLQSALSCVWSKLIWLLVTSTVRRGERKMVMTNNGTARSRKRSPTRIYQSHTAPRRCGFPRNGPGEGADVCGFIKPPNTDGEWQIRGHGSFDINHDVFGIRPTDQSCHDEAWIHVSYANAWLVDRYRFRNAALTKCDCRQGKKRGNPCDHCDHSLVQWNVSSI